MKKSKQMLLEMGGIALPVIRKTLQVEQSTFEKLEVGDVIEFPKKKGKKFIVTKVAKFGGYVYYVPFSGLEMAKKDELEGVRVVDKTG
jgi:hypothetical protein